MNNSLIIFIIMTIILFYGAWKLMNYGQKKTIIGDVKEIIKDRNKKKTN
jgi:hypothetical protein